MSDSTVARGASRMGLATLVSRILGLAREQVAAYLFGASNAMDAFNIAFRIPNLLRDLFAEGAMSAAFVPNFTRALTESKKSALTLLMSVLTVLLLITGAITVVGVAISPQLVDLYAGTYKSVPGKFELTVDLTRMMFPFFPMVAMAAVMMGALNALGFFFLPAFAPVLFNVASIACGVILVPLLSRYTQIPPIYGMGVGVVLGGFLQFYVQWWQIRKQGFSLRAEWRALRHPFQTPGVRAVLALLVPGTIGLAATQLNILINSVYATSAGTGAVSWLNYAFRLMQFPIGIFGVSLAAAVLPQVVRALARNAHGDAGREVNQCLRLTFSVNGPAAAGLMAVGLPIIQLLFQHGEFTLDDSRQSAAALFWYGLGLPGYSAVKVLVPVFYALGTTRIPVVASFVMVALTAVFNHVSLHVLHLPFWSLAAATSLTATLNAVVLALYLRRRLPGAIDGGLVRNLTLHALVSLAIGVSGWGVLRLFSRFEEAASAFFGGRMLLWGAEIVLAIVVAGLLWWGLGRLLRIEENQRATSFLLKRFRRTA